MITRPMKSTLTTLIPGLIGWAIGTSKPDSAIMAEFISGATRNDISLSLRYHGLMPHIAKYVRDNKLAVPDETKDQLVQLYRQVVAHNILLEQGYLELARLMLKNNIPTLPLKGVHFILVSQGQTSCRPMCDIDILVRPENYEQCEAVLLKNGFEHIHEDREYWREKQMHLAFKKQCLSGAMLYAVEIHWSLDYPRDYPLLPQLWNRTYHVNRDGQDVLVMSHEDTLFSLALHSRHYGSLLQLKYVIDVGQLFRRYSKSLDQDYILKEARRSKLNSLLYSLLAQTAPFYNDEIMSSLMDNLRVGRIKRWLISIFLERFQYSVGINQHGKFLFAVFHCLLFDSWIEPIAYTLFIPYEQFCKYYNLLPRTLSSRIRYEIRHFYGIYRILRNALRF
jgi:hypothetical protein